MTEQEKNRFKNALALISIKYMDSIIENENVQTLMRNPSVLVKFMDSGPFNSNLTLSGKAVTGCTVNGFTDYLHKPPTVYINRASATPATIVHELLHYLTHKDFHKAFSSDIVEGVTEYFTRKVIVRGKNETYGEFRVDRTGIYDLQHADIGLARGFIKGTPKEARSGYMKRAYFQGDASAIQLLKSIVG